jgi:hypothetical protein
MKKICAILLASTAIAVGTGIPAWSAMHGMEQSSIPSSDDSVMKLASDNDDRDRGRSARGGDADHRYGRSASANPVPAGAVAPPANGLFGSGIVPKVKVN